MDPAGAPVSGAVAIWVKTPGLSPVKTRLAAGIGRPAAEHFHLLAATAVAAVVQRVAADLPGTLIPCWAVAERGATFWSGLEVVEQGEGGLGERLARVYDNLLARHSFVLFLGADSPQLSPALLSDAVARTRGGEFVLGPAEDGGFYLFGGSRPLPRECWTGVPYSNPETLTALESALHPHGTVTRLATLGDVDTAADLAPLREALARAENLLPEQTALVSWLRQLPD
jgi:glycosyltransferase A (GT-A) superfamily protein (DUF2064 family)